MVKQEEHYDVTPCAGVWIEINLDNAYKLVEIVTPCAGVWIEIWTL